MRKLKNNEIPRLTVSQAVNAQRHPVVLVLENIRSAHNVGSIARTCDAALITQLIVTGFTPSPDHRSALKAALGAQDTVPWSRRETALEAVNEFREQGYRIVSLELTDTSRETDELNPADFPLCLIAGNEVEGVSDSIIAQSDFAIEIPQFGAKQSLNVSVAVGVALFDLVRTFRRLDGQDQTH